MSTKITPVVNENIFEYFAEWKIENIFYSKDALKNTNAFSPIPNSDIKFHLELRFERQNNIEITLVKIPGTVNNPSLKMKSDVRVSDFSGNCLKYYPSAPAINISEFARFTFYEKDQCPSFFYGHYNFIISCHMKFFEFSFIRPVACRKEDWYSDENSEDKPSILGDIELQVGNESFPVHKAVLRARAPVFLRKLSGNDPYTHGKIVIKDSSFSNTNVRCFLNYLYSGEIDDKFSINTLYDLAHKYEIGTLKRDCALLLASSLNFGSVCDILKLAYDCDDATLKQKAIAFAADHVNELLKTARWKALLLKYPMIGYDVMAISFSKK